MSVIIQYTWASNLALDKFIETGKMSFKDESLVNEFQIETNTELLKEIASTKREDYPDLREEYEEHMIQLRKEKKKGMSKYYEYLKQ